VPYISDIRDAITDDIDDVVYTFNQTLQWFLLYIEVPPSTTTTKSNRFGAGWVDFPFMTTQTDFKPVIINHGLPNHCPNVQLVNFTDRKLYPCDTIVFSALTTLVNLHFVRMSAILILFRQRRNWVSLLGGPSQQQETIRQLLVLFDRSVGLVPPVSDKAGYNIRACISVRVHDALWMSGPGDAQP
ncbi:hypothetical protein EC957_008806, partial [Mortierella hygrophila]